MKRTIGIIMLFVVLVATATSQEAVKPKAKRVDVVTIAWLQRLTR
jgi:hypothetical protein